MLEEDNDKAWDTATPARDRLVKHKAVATREGWAISVPGGGNAEELRLRLNAPVGRNSMCLDLESPVL